MERILLVEDEASNRAIINAQLRRSGYVVDQAEDGKIAWDMLIAKPSLYSVVVSDRNMPNMDGLKLYSKMKTHEILRQIPFIMQTAATAPEEVVEGIRAGVYYYLTKPYKEETLLTLVRSAINERRKGEMFETRISKQREALGTFMRGEFQIRTIEEAQNISFLLGSIFPRPQLAVSGLYELLLNSIEHGNLKIGFEGKAKLLSTAEWENTIRKMSSLPENAGKKVDVQFAQNENMMEVIISDDGEGFDWRPYLEIEPSRATRANGRGIAKANLLSFDQLSYMDKGNKVRVSNKRVQ